MKIYLAGPLFTEAERAWMGDLKTRILDLAARIGVEVDVMWPWEFVSQHELQALGDQAGREIFRPCFSHLKSADVLIALLDGPMVDDGTAWEIGFFYSRRKAGQSIIGIRTDIRNAGECSGSIINAMIEYSCDHIARGKEELLRLLEQCLKQRL